MQTVDDPCTHKKPRAIDEEFLQEKLLEYTNTQGEVGRLARNEGVPFDKAEVIYLDYSNIIKIDHLWLLKNLKKLVMNNNWIDKIECIDTLIHLTHLDLSFNKISKIEGLEKLVNLEQLSLFDNQITIIENMDTLQNLVIFSIGRNQITEKKNVLYLRRLKNLKSLNMAENPCAYEEHFNLYIAAFLPQLSYYEYKFIHDLEREVGIDSFREDYNEIEQKEVVERARQAVKQKELDDAQLHAKSFVEYLNTRAFFDSLWLDDPDGKALLEIGEEMSDLYIEFEDNFIEQCKHIFELGQEYYDYRKSETDQYNENVQAARLENQQKSIQYMEDFLLEKALIFDKIRGSQQQINQFVSIDEYNTAIHSHSSTFQTLLHTTWKSLMKLELELFEQMMEVNETFERSLTDLINSFIEGAQGMFTQIRDLESDFTDAVAETARRYQVNVGNMEDNTNVMPLSLKEIMVDKETLTNALASSHEVHSILIDGREDTLITNSREWLDKLVNNLEKDEISRNRDKVMEISYFIDIQKAEFDTLANTILENQDLTFGLIE